MTEETPKPERVLVGRQRELTALWSQFEKTTAGRLHVTLVAGEWKGSGAVTLQGQPFPLKARWKNELVAAGYGLRCEVRMIGFPGTEEFIEIEQIGYDDYERQFHMGTLCIFGEIHDLRGDWQDNQLLVKDDRESFEIRVVSPEKLKVHVVNAGGGPAFDMDFEKQPTQ